MQTLMGYMPASLLAVLAGTVLNEAFLASGSSLAVSSSHKVQIPVYQSFSDTLKFFAFPNWGAITDANVWIVSVTLAAVASLESLLSVEAVDRLDPLKRKSNANRELLAQGLGNVVSGLVGGMPVTAVIVRSATNVESGGKTRLSAFIHGLWLIVALTLVPALLNKIPLASLAAVLLVVGYKLTQVGLFTSTFAKGWRVFAPFIATVLFTVFVDLLVGIGVGICVGIIVVWIDNTRNAYTIEKQEDAKQHTVTFLLSEDVTALNKPSLAAALNNVPKGSHVVIDAENTEHIDPDVLEMVEEFAHNAHFNNMKVELRNFPPTN
jgi:MFS superfamily sulfate permease-like transporter